MSRTAPTRTAPTERLANHQAYGKAFLTQGKFRKAADEFCAGADLAAKLGNATIRDACWQAFHAAVRKTAEVSGK